MCQLEQGQVKPTQKHESLGIHTQHTKKTLFWGISDLCCKKRGANTSQTSKQPSSLWVSGPIFGNGIHLEWIYQPATFIVGSFHISLMWSIKFQQNATSLNSLCFQRVLKDWDVPRVCVVVRRSTFSRCHAYPKVKWATWGLSPLRQRDPLWWSNDLCVKFESYRLIHQPRNPPKTLKLKVFACLYTWFLSTPQCGVTQEDSFLLAEVNPHGPTRPRWFASFICHLRHISCGLWRASGSEAEPKRWWENILNGFKLHLREKKKSLQKTEFSP